MQILRIAFQTAEFLGEKDYDNLIDFVGNRFDRAGKKFNYSQVYNEDSEESAQEDTSFTWLSCRRPRKRPEVDPNFALRLGDATHIAASQPDSAKWFGSQYPRRQRHDGIVRVGFKKRRSAAAAPAAAADAVYHSWKGDATMQSVSECKFVPVAPSLPNAAVPTTTPHLTPFGRRSSRFLLTPPPFKSRSTTSLRMRLTKRISVLCLGVDKLSHEKIELAKPLMAGWLWTMTERGSVSLQRTRASIG